jgi:hypothetical protein
MPLSSPSTTQVPSTRNLDRFHRSSNLKPHQDRKLRYTGILILDLHWNPWKSRYKLHLAVGLCYNYKVSDLNLVVNILIT